MNAEQQVLRTNAGVESLFKAAESQQEGGLSSRAHVEPPQFTVYILLSLHLSINLNSAADLTSLHVFAADIGKCKWDESQTHVNVLLPCSVIKYA